MTYRKFDVGIWSDTKFERLSAIEKCLFIYLWTNKECSQAGIYRITKQRIAFETKIPLEEGSREVEGGLVGGSTPLEPLLKVLDEKHQLIHWFPNDEIVFVKGFLRGQCQNKQFAEGALKTVVKDYSKYLKLYIDTNLEVFKEYGIKVPDFGVEEGLMGGSRGVDGGFKGGSTIYTVSVSDTDINNSSIKDITPTPPISPPSPNSEKKSSISRGDRELEPSIPYESIVADLNKRAGTNFQAGSRKTRGLIKARFNDGYTLDDFKTVHRKKAYEWVNDAKYSKYLRPETLYGSKFEGYLNQRDPPRRILSEAGQRAVEVLNNLELD